MGNMEADLQSERKGRQWSKDGSWWEPKRGRDDGGVVLRLFGSGRGDPASLTIFQYRSF
jgi:hypothetical protein